LSVTSDFGTKPSFLSSLRISRSAAHEPALGKEFLHVAVAEREAQVQPNGVLAEIAFRRADSSGDDPRPAYGIDGTLAWEDG
jgi:hypothetical protein